MAWSFVTDAGRWGHPDRALAALDDLGMTATSPASRARAADVVARARGDAASLVDAAEQQLAVGFFGHAAELTDLARAATSDRATTHAVSAVEARLGRLTGGRTTRRQAQGVQARLTERENEVAHLAADGRSDREIATLLTLSVRTVQSHLATAYRKLGVTSRTELDPVLPSLNRT